MSNVVDNRVVEMRFDNAQFESGVKTSMSTLERLKNSLKLTEASKGLENLNAAAKNTNLSGLSSGIEAVQMKFSALQVAGITALSNITNAAVNTGKRMASAITIDPIKNGFAEYETQMNAVQTILANTQKEGTNVTQVNAALDELNTYADKTIYNFTEMTRNIGTFTAAGVKLNDSVNAIKGIANLAAVSGSSSQQASVAMYQLSQALAAGKVQLMDWNSVVNAGMGGQVFQDALIRTSEHLKTGAKDAINTYGTFRESLTQGAWLTTEVLTETLNQIGGAYSKVDLLAQGYTEEQADEIMKLAETATDAATKVKTFSQLLDTLGEALGSGWTTSWRLIIGDFEESKELFTSISDTLGTMINDSSEARNQMLLDWKNLGGRNDLLSGFSNIFDTLVKIISTVKDAFNDIFPPMTAERLASITAGFKNITEAIKPSAETLDKIKRVATGVFSAFDLVRKGITTLLSPIKEFIGSGGLASIADILLSAAAAVGDFITAINKGIGTEQFFSGLSNALSTVGEKVADVFNSLRDKFSNFGSIFSSIGDAVSKVLGKLGDGFRTAFEWVKENVSVGDIFNGLNAAGLIGFVAKISGPLKTLKELMSGGIKGLIFGTDNGDDDGPSIKENFCDILDSVHESIASFSMGIKVGSLVAIAGAVAILTASLNSLSKIDAGDMAKGLAGIGALMKMLNTSFKSITGVLGEYKGGQSIIKTAAALVLMAAAIKMFASALEKVSAIPLPNLVTGLAGLGVSLKLMTTALKKIDGSNISLKTSVALLALAQSCKMLADALGKFAGFSWNEIAHGLVAMGGALAELVAATSVLGKFGGGKSLIGSASLLILTASLGKIGDALKSIATLSWDGIERGLTGMGVALGELVTAIAILSKVGGKGSIVGATSVLIVVQALDKISDNLERLGNLSWDQIEHGLNAMGGALLELVTAIAVLSKVGGMNSLTGSVSLLIAVQTLDAIGEALKSISTLSWDAIERGLAGMGGALAELGITVGLLGKFAGMSGLLGAGSLLIAVQALQPIADALQQLGSMSWEEIGRGLAAMGGALAELGTASFLTGLGGLASVVGAGTLYAVVDCLDQLATNFQKFGSMSWDEIGQGLAAMGGALAELGTASFLTGLGGVASLVGAGSIDLAIQGLNQLADALQKFGSMSWDEIGQGLAAMGGALGELALGDFLNSFGVFGADVISQVAEPLGTLADSVKKWADVSIPDSLGLQLAALGTGISSFTFSGWGADAIATVAGPLGTLATSVKQWSDVSIPDGIGDQLGRLADGVGRFWNSGWGADAISTVAAPLGTLASSVKQWSDVSIPDTLPSNLESLAHGIESFSFAFAGGWSIGAVAGPLGDLAVAVSKWNDVNLHASMGSNLQELAEGINAFSLSFAGGWSLGAITGPLGDLADSLIKWNDVSLHASMGSNLQELASGVNAFSLSFSSGWSLGAITGPLGDLAVSVSKWNGVSIPENLSEGLSSLANGISAFSNSANINLGAASTAIDSIANSVSKLNGIDFTAITSGISNLANTINGINISPDAFSGLGTQIISGLVAALSSGVSTVHAAAASLGRAAIAGIRSSISGASSGGASAGRALVTSVANGIRSGSSSVVSAANQIVSRTVAAIRSKMSTFQAAGRQLAVSVANGIRSGSSAVSSATSSLVSGAASSLRGYRGSFYSAGTYVASGFASGIRTQISSAASAAAAMASAASSAARRNLKIKSPSRVFKEIGGYVPQGFAIGIGMFSNSVTDATRGMTDSAIDGTRDAIAQISSVLDSDLDSQPTIRPVVDLSNVASGAATIGNMLSLDPSISAMSNSRAISTMMAQKNQNGVNDDVVDAINKLHKSIDKLEGNTTIIDGITYDDGSNIASAVTQLARAAIMERRI